MKFKFCQVGMGADDTQFASAFPSTKEALVKELGQQNLVNAIVQNLGVDPKDKSAFKRLDGFIRGEICKREQTHYLVRGYFRLGKPP